MIRVALGAIAGCLAAVSLYALLRGVQLVLFREANPATVIWSTHAGYFWRALIVSYAGGMAAIVTWLAAGLAPDKVARVLTRAVVVAAALSVLQGFLLP
jgi:hypothetical protein